MNYKMERALSALAEAARTLAKVRSIETVKDIHDAAETQIAAAKRAGLPNGVQNTLAEVGLRAARRAGQLLAETPLSHSGRPAKEDPAKQDKTLRELGLNKNRSSRSRRLATIPVELFEGHLAESRRLGKAPSAAKLLRLAADLKHSARAKPLKDAPAPVMSVESRVSAGASPPEIADDLDELQDHLEHFGNLFKSLVENSEQEPPATKRRAASVLKVMQEIVAKLRSNPAS